MGIPLILPRAAAAIQTTPPGTVEAQEVLKLLKLCMAKKTDKYKI
jgi:hypothetical protein